MHFQTGSRIASQNVQLFDNDDSINGERIKSHTCYGFSFVELHPHLIKQVNRPPRVATNLKRVRMKLEGWNWNEGTCENKILGSPV